VTDAIGFYIARGPNGYLSNLYPCHVSFEGTGFESAEHAYQYGKPRDTNVAAWIAGAPSPRLAAMAGHHLSLYDIRRDWDRTKLARMRRVVEAKFRQNPELRERLLSTGDAQLVEEGPDSFWGAGRRGDGHNWLGMILGEVREKLRGEVV
jgi:N-glycosidase YbiA